MTKAFADPLFAGVALLCFAVSGAPLQAVAQSGTALASLDIADPTGASIDHDIEGTAGTPAAVSTQLSDLAWVLNGARISAGATDFAIDLSSVDIGSFENTATGELISGVTAAKFTSAQLGTFSNAGRIAATNDGYAFAGVYMDNASVGAFTNEVGGQILGDFYGVRATTTNVSSFVNEGLIKGGADSLQGWGLSLESVNAGQLGNSSLTNRAGGAIAGGLWGAHLYFASFDEFTNAGSIEATNPDGGIGLGIFGSTIGSFVNASGASIKGGAVGLAINQSTFASLVNDGLIEGQTAITYSDFDGRGLTITNSGTIRSTTNGTAIDFGFDDPLLERDDTLILKTGSVIIGEVKFAGGDDTLDVTDFSGSADLYVSGLERMVRGQTIVLDPASNLALSYDPPEEPEEPDGPDQNPVDPTPPNPPPPNPPPTRVVVVDPATVVPNTVAQSTAGVVQGIAGLIGSQAMSAGYSGSLMSPAAAAGGSAVLTALDIGEAERPRIWGDVFGYGSNGPAPAQLSGLAVGADTKFGSTFSAGALLSYSQSAASFTAGDALTSRTGVAGFYGTYHAGVLDVGFSLLGGVQAHESFRRIATAGGFETARGSFGGVFAAPGASAALPLASIGSTTVALRASATYVIGVTSGYTETGSSSNLTIGPRPITSLDARFGLEARHAIIAGSLVGEGVVRAGVFGLMNGGGASVPVTLFGQTVNVATTPSSVYGVYAGAGAVANLSETIRFELNADTAARTDGSLSLSLRGGVSGTF